jgi:purine-binding chemotaxis protein CheW
MTAEIVALPEQYLVFKLGGKDFGFEGRFLWEAATTVPFTEVPRKAGFVTGVTQMHGKIIPVLDMAGLLGVSAAFLPEGFIVVNLPGEAEFLAGFAVDRVVGFARVRSADTLPPERGPGEADIPYLKGWVGEGVKFPWLDIERLIRDQTPGDTGRKTI